MLDDDNSINQPTRRAFLRRAAGTVGLTLIPTSLAGLVSACSDESLVAADEAFAGKALAKAGKGKGGYGELVDNGGVISLPEGFQYRTFGAL